MTLLSGLAARVGAAVAQPGAQAVAAGVLAGALGAGSLVAAGAIPLAGTATVVPTVALLSCPGYGLQVARVPSGATWLATARSADDRWVEIYVGDTGVDHGWAPVSAFQLAGLIDGLPVDACSEPMPSSPAEYESPGPTVTALGTEAPTVTAAPGFTPAPQVTAGPTLAPGATATPSPIATPIPTSAPTAVPTAVPTHAPTPAPTPVPTPVPTPPDVTAPQLSNLTTTGFFDSGTGYYFVSRPSSGCLYPHTATVTVTATDPDDAVFGVTLYYQKPNHGIFDIPTSVAMTHGSGSSWLGTITVPDAWSTGIVEYYVQAQDSHGNLSDYYFYADNYTLDVDQCIV